MKLTTIFLIISLLFTSSYTLGSSLASETQSTEDYRGDRVLSAGASTAATVARTTTTTGPATADDRGITNTTTTSESSTSSSTDHEAVVPPSVSPPAGEVISRLLLGRHYVNPRPYPMTCDRFPRICRATGSPGPDCCKKRCVDVMGDSQNCGWCGNRCGYGEACCRGTCVNVMYDRRNCGGCRKRCKRGSYCRYGMCNYA